VTEPPATGRDALLAGAIGHFAERGVGDTSLRALAEAIGTSHRMLIYHFGSRDGLLAAVLDAGMRYWRLVTAEALVYGPLFFELTSHAMLGLPYAVDVRVRLVTTWLDALTSMWTARGVPTREARAQASLDLAMARGLLHDLLLSGDRKRVDAAMLRYSRATVGGMLA
jgi:AcrR family transcriptional regulator